MVKPLNKEWELFGRKYRIPGAKGEKVDCNACGKQVSAAVNRLQSHLRVCPARPVLPFGLGPSTPQPPHAATIPTANSSSSSTAAAAAAAAAVAAHIATSTTGAVAALDLGHPPPGSMAMTDATAASVAAPAAASGLADDAGDLGLHLPAAKRPRTSPTSSSSSATGRRRWPGDDLWFAAATPMTTAAMARDPVAYARRRLEIEERRLELELQREQRDAAREPYHLEILQSQALATRAAADKEVYEARALLALSRKNLRDQGVTEDEIDRILPVEPLTTAPASAPAVPGSTTSGPPSAPSSSSSVASSTAASPSADATPAETTSAPVPGSSTTSPDATAPSLTTTITSPAPATPQNPLEVTVKLNAETVI